MIILHFDLQPQFKFLNYFIYTSHHFTPHGRYELNKLTSLPMCGFIAQLVEHCTGIAEVTGSNPVETLNFFQASSFQLLKLENLLRWSFFTLITKCVYRLFKAACTCQEKSGRGICLFLLVIVFLNTELIHALTPSDMMHGDNKGKLRSASDLCMRHVCCVVRYKNVHLKNNLLVTSLC